MSFLIIFFHIPSNPNKLGVFLHHSIKMFSSCVPLLSTLVNPMATISSIPTSLIHFPHLHFIPPTPLIFVLLLFSTLFIGLFSTPQTLNVGAPHSFVHRLLFTISVHIFDDRSTLMFNEVNCPGILILCRIVDSVEV